MLFSRRQDRVIQCRGLPSTGGISCCAVTAEQELCPIIVSSLLHTVIYRALASPTLPETGYLDHTSIIGTATQMLSWPVAGSDNHHAYVACGGWGAYMAGLRVWRQVVLHPLVVASLLFGVTLGEKSMPTIVISAGELRHGL